MRRLLKLAYLLVFLLVSGSLYAQNEEIEILRQRLIEDALAKNGFLPRVGRYIEPDFNATATFLAEQEADGSWNSVDYLDTDNTWDPLHALNRILIMSLAYNNPDDPFYQNEKLLQGITNALVYWYQVSPHCVNWYKNDIAKQMYSSVIAILLQGHIREDLMWKLIEDQTPRPRMTGSNRTLLSISVFYRGVLEKNQERIQSGVAGVMDPIIISEEEGIQVDYSFHQHGPYIYNGSYGANFLRETAWLASIVQGTSYAFEEEQMKILRDYFQHGSRWMIYKGVFDYNARGRQVGRPTGLSPNANLFIPNLQYMSKADPDFEDLYQASINRIKQQEPQAVEGLKHFWRSDYTLAYRKNHLITLRMCSKRTTGVETNVNFENLLGYYLPYGLTYIYQSGEELENIFPVWDWSRLPGVTSPNYVPIVKGNFTQPTSFVGGITDGSVGISTMDLEVESTKGKKSWFWFEDGFVALGADIRSKSEDEITTGVNQTALNGPVIVDGEVLSTETTSGLSANWIWHDHVAYFFPGSSRNLMVEAKEKSGSLKQIFGLAKDTIFRKEIFSLWFDHGHQPESATYAYAVFPGVGQEEAKALHEELPFEILENSKELQAVRDINTGNLAIVFHDTVKFQLSKKTALSVSDPCLLYIDLENDQVTVGDPTASLEELSISFRRSKGKNFEQKIITKLPVGAFAGKSKVVALDVKIKALKKIRS